MLPRSNLTKRKYLVDRSLKTTYCWTMKNKIVRTFMIGLSVLALHVVGQPAWSIPPDKSLRVCSQDDECAVVDGSFCHCAVENGREQFAVNKKYKSKFEKQIERQLRQKNVGCLLGFREEDAKKCSNLRAVCIAKLCEVR